jgi:hypothetical protein
MAKSDFFMILSKICTVTAALALSAWYLVGHSTGHFEVLWPLILVTVAAGLGVAVSLILAEIASILEARRRKTDC